MILDVLDGSKGVNYTEQKYKNENNILLYNILLYNVFL